MISRQPADWPMTAKNNVLIGRVDRPAHDELWMGAVEAAGLSRLLAELPEGGDTVLSRKFDNGHDLSGGQWQRFAVARAIYRDAAVLLADEPTSALDPKAEANVLARLCRDDAGRDSLGRITVIVTHRLVNVRLADRIVVLRDGVVVETGTHDELMTRCGHYWEMYRAQSLVYSSSDEKGVLPVRAQSR